MRNLVLMPHNRVGGLLVYECQQCGATRTCRQGWRTRCHVCLDERAAPSLEVLDMGADVVKQLLDDRELDEEVRDVLELGPHDAVSATAAAGYCAGAALADEMIRYERAGWTVLATDVHGLPWYGERLQSASHGTIGRHRCGARQRMTEGALDCVQCGPEPGSRTHLTRQDDPYLLYLVRFGDLLKFGVGDIRRVREHLRAGAEPVQVVRARHADVIEAERQLTRRYRSHVAPPASAGMPRSFGERTEVVLATVPVDLADFLTGQDMMYRFRHAPDPLSGGR